MYLPSLHYDSYIFQSLLPLEGLALVLLVICLVTVHLCYMGVQKKAQRLLERFPPTIQKNEAYGLVLGRREAHITPVYEDGTGSGTGSAVYEMVDDDIADYVNENAHYSMDTNECYVSRPADVQPTAQAH